MNRKADKPKEQPVLDGLSDSGRSKVDPEAVGTSLRSVSDCRFGLPIWIYRSSLSDGQRKDEQKS